ncbi:MAG TPA: peptide deformylase [Verrucomicrobiae bacterium]|jgi:peptide deformylase|nr:peptide deformylase [Verrucomicrobiae bacterium]
MALLKVLIYPNPVLTQQALPLESFGPREQKLFDDLVDTMYHEDGVGLAAPQVGISQRILIVSPRAKRGEEEVVVNPVIYESRGQEIGPEGCLSFPGLTAEVMRATRIRVRYQDREGKPVDRELKDFFARVIQHEMDHLDGITLIDRVDFNQRMKLLSQYQQQAQD